jgi:GNAT superfamily N-acetyltransferase
MDPAIRILQASGDQIGLVRELWNEYWASLGFSRDFQHFDAELSSLPGAYSAPRGRLLIAFLGDQPAATAALRPLSEEACEIKRMYVRPQDRGHGLGRLLLKHLLDEARSEGYTRMYADTMPTLTTALALYRSAGFVDIGPYGDDPTPGAVYLLCELR